MRLYILGIIMKSFPGEISSLFIRIWSITPNDDEAIKKSHINIPTYSYAKADIREPKSLSSLNALPRSTRHNEMSALASCACQGFRILGIDDVARCSRVGKLGNTLRGGRNRDSWQYARNLPIYVYTYSHRAI